MVAEKLDVCPPCGGCRQRLKEFAAPGTPVYLGRPGGPAQTTTMGELLPLAFDEESLAMSAAEAGAAVLRSAPAPRVGIVLGSGLGAVADAVQDAVSLGYDELPGFPRPTVHGHAGRAVLGHLGGVPVACSWAARTSTRAATPGRASRPCAPSPPPAPRSSCSPTPRARCAPRSAPGG